MACPSCGHKFYSDFKMGDANRNAHRGILITIFELPYKIMMRIWRYFFHKRLCLSSGTNI